MIHRTPFFVPWLYPSLTWRMPTREKEIYLTFDDGPVPGPTEFVIDTLNHYNAKATFFCIGENIAKHAEVFKKIAASHHVVGNHTFNHVNGWRSGVAEYCSNIERCTAEIERHMSSVGNSPVALFRPPYGRIARDQIKALSAYKIIMWDVLSVDYEKNLPPEKCLRNTIRATREGSLVVFHDSYKAEKNLTFALPRFIEHFASKGFTFKAILA